MKEYTKPDEIEKRSFGIIQSELKTPVPEAVAPVVLRVIHTTADFSYAENLYFSEGAVEAAVKAIRSGCTFVTDTNMALAGINKKALEELGCRAVCYISDSAVADEAKECGCTRAAAAVRRAARDNGGCIMVVGNAPTALMELCRLHENENFTPPLVIGVPVGFVNVVEAKERLIKTNVPCIASMGRKGGSNVAAAIVNALLYMCTEDGREWRRCRR